MAIEHATRPIANDHRYLVVLTLSGCATSASGLGLKISVAYHWFVCAAVANKASVRSGAEAGAITQDPIGIGYKCVDSAVKAIKGESLPKSIDTGFYWYDKTNIDDPKIKAVLYD